MFAWFSKKARLRRAKAYLRKFPEDEPAAFAILSFVDLFAVQTAREAAEMLAGTQMTDDEWGKVAPRWEKTWAAIVT